MTDVPPAAPAGSGRRRVAEATRRRPSPLTVLAVLIPLLTVAALALVRPAPTPPTSYAPSEAPLDRSTAVCPPRLPGADELRLGSTGLGSGDVALRVGRDDATATLESGVATRRERASVVVNGTGELAPGLVVSRSGAGSAVGCDQPLPERWFTGLGASAEHSSTLTLVNPDKGPAVADVTLWDGSGLVDVPALRGVRVPGGGTVSFDLSDVAPNRDALAAQVLVSRGRLASSVVDVLDPVGRDKPVREWLPAQDAPAPTSYVVGVGAGPADRVLTLANPGDSEVRVELELVSEESEFAPSGLRGGAARARRRSARSTSPACCAVARPRAYRPCASRPRARSPRRCASGRRTTWRSPWPAPRWRGRRQRRCPRVRSGSSSRARTRPGCWCSSAWDADGEAVVRERRVEVAPATAARIRLPDEAVLALVGLERTDAVVSLEVSDRGLSVLPLTQLTTTSQVPDVRPAQR